MMSSVQPTAVLPFGIQMEFPLAHIAVSDLPMRVSVTRRSRQERATILTAAMATGYMSGLLVLLLSFNKLSCVKFTDWSYDKLVPAATQNRNKDLPSSNTNI